MYNQHTVHVSGKNRDIAFQCLKFDSVAACAEYARTSERDEFPISARTYERVKSGDLSRVAESDSYLARLEALSPSVTVSRHTLPCVAGGLADVPAYLAGSPAAMRRRASVPTPAPITIVADIATSQVTGAHIIARRGAATLALLRRLEMTGHPVTVYAGYCAHHDDGKAGKRDVAMVARIESAPIDLARAAWILGAPEMQREICFRAGHRLSEGRERGISWPAFPGWYGAAVATPEQVAVYRGALGLADHEPLIVLPPVSYSVHDLFSDDESTLQWIESAYRAALESAGMAPA